MRECVSEVRHRLVATVPLAPAEEIREDSPSVRRRRRYKNSRRALAGDRTFEWNLAWQFDSIWVEHFLRCCSSIFMQLTSVSFSTYGSLALFCWILTEIILNRNFIFEWTLTSRVLNAVPAPNCIPICQNNDIVFKLFTRFFGAFLRCSPSSYPEDVSIQTATFISQAPYSFLATPQQSTSQTFRISQENQKIRATAIFLFGFP